MPWGISNEYRFVFIHIPKTAGCAINAFLKNYMHVGSNHATISEAEAWHKARQIEIPWEMFQPFAVVRNPYDRFALSYFYKRGQRVHRKVSESEIFRLLENGNQALRTQVSWINDRVRLLKFENLTNDLNEFLNEVEIPLYAEDMPIVHKVVAEEKFDDHFAPGDKEIIRNVYKEDFKLWENLR